MTVSVSHTLKEIDEEAWNSVFPRHLEGYSFFRTIDETLREQFRFYYVAVYDRHGLACLAPCFLMDYPMDTTIEGPLKPVLAWVRARTPGFLTLRALICGSPTGKGRIGLREGARQELLNAVVGEMRAIAQREHAHLLAFKDFSKPQTAFLDSLTQMGFRKIASYPAAWLDISFPSLEAYLASLSKATRKDLNRKFRKLEGQAKIQMEVRSELGELADEVYALYRQNYDKSAVQFERLTKEFFVRISTNLPSRSRYFLWRMGGRLIAFDLCLVSEDLLIDEYLGMDYTVAYTYHLYFVTFRDILEWCLAHRIRRYESGLLNYEPKKRLDFTFAPQYLYVRHTNPLLNVFFKPFSPMLEPQRFDPVLKSLEMKEPA